MSLNPSTSLEVITPRPVRVLVVDDSAYMRHIICKHLEAAPGLTVAGVAHEGREALKLIPTLNPDVVTLDVEMPGLDGLATLREIMARFPRPVVMLSSLTAAGTTETVRALTWGAVDFVAKPVVRANVAAVMDDVIAKVRAAAQTHVRPIAPAPAPAMPHLGKPRPVRKHDKVVVIGASTGGPRALHTVLQELPNDLPAAFLIIQHLPVGFTRSLAERLDAASPLAIREAAAGDALEIGRGLLAPGGRHMTLDEQGRIALNQDPTLHGVRPAIDVTMAAVARHYGQRAVGVVLTGMGHDGTEGARRIRAAGGRVAAEAEASCVVWGMPRSVVEAGAADSVVPLSGMAQEIERLVRG
jgi:two-component system chemotaxis response regulator CheB